MNLVAIDPGFAKSGKGCAVAVFVDRHLVRVLFARPTSVFVIGAIELVVWERPQYDARTRVSAADVIRLTAEGAELAGRLAGLLDAAVEAVEPREWKGSEPKPVHHVRVLGALAPDELEIVGGEDTRRIVLAARERGALERWRRPGAAYYPRGWLTHNLLDAAGLGLWRLGRLAKSA